jgi:hypothetical protein
MKLIIFLLLIPFIALSQNIDTSSANTKLEATALKVGAIIKKKYDKFYEYAPKGAILVSSFGLGGNHNLDFSSLTIKDVASGITFKGLYLSTYSSDTRSTYSGYIDAEEIGGLIKFLEFLVANKGNIEDEGTEYIYTCNDVQFASFNSKVKKEVKWLYRVKVDKYRAYSEVYLPEKNVEELLAKLKENKSKFE